MKKLILINPLDPALAKGFNDFAKIIKKVFTKEDYMAVAMIHSSESEIKTYTDKLTNHSLTLYNNKNEWYPKEKDYNKFLLEIYNSFFSKDCSYSYVLGLVHFPEKKIEKIFEFFKIPFRKQQIKGVKCYVSMFTALDDSGLEKPL